jgi:hypothetical protein
MNPRTEANLNQMAADIHLVTAPVRWVVEYVQFVIGFTLTIFALPLVLVALAIHRVVTGHPLFDGGIAAVPAVFYVFGPLAITLVYCWFTHTSGWSFRSYRGIYPTYVFALTVLLAIVSPFILWHPAMYHPITGGVDSIYVATEAGFTVLVMYLSSPLLLLIFRKKAQEGPSVTNEELARAWKNFPNDPLWAKINAPVQHAEYAGKFGFIFWSTLLLSILGYLFVCLVAIGMVVS